MKTLLTFLAAFVLLTITAQAQIINIPDTNFKNALVGTPCAIIGTSTIWADVDTNNNNQIEVSEAAVVTKISFGAHNVVSTVGIQSFINLQSLYCEYNSITTLDLQGLYSLTHINCSNNLITNLNLSNLINLQFLNCSFNQLSFLNVQNLTNLLSINCGANQLQYLDVSGLTNLEILGCSNNQITTLNVSGCTNLYHLMSGENPLEELNVENLTNLAELNSNPGNLSSINISGCINLQNLYCRNNRLTTVNTEGLINLRNIDIDNNQLTSLFIKNGSDEFNISFGNNPNLVYICCDDTKIDYIRQSAIVCGVPNCNINSYCSFTLGGVFYTLQGQNKLDTNANGCDSNDIIFPNMKYNITNNITFGSTISNSSGHYDIAVQEGTHTLKPILPHPNYYTISPDSVQVTFPNTVNDTLTQDFCITPNGAHHDLEITIIPVVPARPGFDAIYQLVYKNNGTVIENDSITLRFNDEILDFVSASIAPNAQRTNYLVWQYSNLQPFETRTITFTLNVNSPMETPPVVIGSVLPIQATIYPFATDETPNDNRSSLRQIVVGSLDPNDKTCLEGDKILPTQIGDYLHYLIRFENTGTYTAENIVVKDVIDTTKFDIKTLEMVTASHDCYARILKQNQVEFIFENINLPFTEPDKHGFVAFKIKTKPTLLLGNIIQNKVDIFFDYNFPIRTNTTTTQIVDFLANQTNKTANIQYLQIQPNPVSTTTLVVWDNPNNQKSEITITDVLGKTVLETQTYTDTYTLNCATWAIGIYTITIKTKNKLSVGRLMR